MKRCKICLGEKKVRGMGGMKEKCATCNGKGFIPDVAPIKASSENIKKEKKYKDK